VFYAASAGVRSHVDANPEARGVLHIRVSQLDLSIDTGCRFSFTVAAVAAKDSRERGRDGEASANKSASRRAVPVSARRIGDRDRAKSASTDRVSISLTFRSVRSYRPFPERCGQHKTLSRHGRDDIEKRCRARGRKTFCTLRAPPPRSPFPRGAIYAPEIQISN